MEPEAFIVYHDHNKRLTPEIEVKLANGLIGSSSVTKATANGMTSQCDKDAY